MTKKKKKKLTMKIMMRRTWNNGFQLKLECHKFPKCKVTVRFPVM